MKLQALIKGLKAVRDDITAKGGDGKNVDVVIRGTKVKGIADISGLKLSKNSKRGQFLVIDKNAGGSDTDD